MEGVGPCMQRALAAGVTSASIVAGQAVPIPHVSQLTSHRAFRITLSPSVRYVFPPSAVAIVLREGS